MSGLYLLKSRLFFPSFLQYSNTLLSYIKTKSCKNQERKHKFPQNFAGAQTNYSFFTHQPIDRRMKALPIQKGKSRQSPVVNPENHVSKDQNEGNRPVQAVLNRGDINLQQEKADPAVENQRRIENRKLQPPRGRFVMQPLQRVL